MGTKKMSPHKQGFGRHFSPYRRVYTHTHTSLRSVPVCLEPNIMLMTLCLKAAGHYVFFWVAGQTLSSEWIREMLTELKALPRAHTQSATLSFGCHFDSLSYTSAKLHTLSSQKSLAFFHFAVGRSRLLSTSGFLFVMESFDFLFILCSIFIYWCFVLYGGLLQYSLQCYQKLFKEKEFKVVCRFELKMLKCDLLFKTVWSSSHNCVVW